MIDHNRLIGKQDLHIFFSSLPYVCLQILFISWLVFHLQWDFKWSRINGHKNKAPTLEQSVQFRSVQSLSHSNPLQPHRLQHTRLPCPSPTPGVYSNSCPLSRWWHWTISSSVIPFSCHLSQHWGLFQWLGSSHQMAKGFSFSIGSSNEYSELISFRIDWFGLLAIQGTVKSLLQHHNLKASILRHSAFFVVQLSHPYMTTGRTTALTIQIFVGKVMSLLFNTLSRFVIAFLPRSKRFSISWLQSTSTVILEPKKIKSVTASTFSPSICHEVMV